MRVTSRFMRKRKTRKTQKGGSGWFGTKRTKPLSSVPTRNTYNRTQNTNVSALAWLEDEEDRMRKPLSSAPTQNTYNRTQNTEDRANALAWLKREEEIMNTATSVEEAVEGLVALKHDPKAVGSNSDPVGSNSDPEPPGVSILDQPLEDVEGAMSIITDTKSTPANMLETLKQRYPNIYSSLLSILKYLGYHLPNSTQEGGAVSAVGVTLGAAGTSQAIGTVGAAGSTMTTAGAAAAGAIAATVCLMILYVVLGICIAIKTSRVLYRISKYIFKIMLFNYKKRIHLQNNDDLTTFPYMEPKMQPLLRWWGSWMTGYKIFPTIGSYIKPGEERGWGLETKVTQSVKPNSVTQNPLYKPANPVTWDKHQEGIDIWYMSSDGKRATELPAGATIVTWTKVEEDDTTVNGGKVKWYESSNGKSVWDLPAPVTWTKVTEGKETWYVSSEGKSAWKLPPGAILK